VADNGRTKPKVCGQAAGSQVAGIQPATHGQDIIVVGQRPDPQRWPDRRSIR
jgi:hypothetical protein